MASPPAGAETIQVFARVRPLLEREREFAEIIETRGNVIAVGDTEKVGRYRFDHIFDQDATQDAIYERTAPLIDAAILGYNATIFAYGQTGTGKTHTMLGEDMWQQASVHPDGHDSGADIARAKRGIIPRAMEHLFAHIERNKATTLFKVWCTYLEIYNERVYDLLRYEESRMMRSGLEVREDKHKGVFVPDATDIMVTSTEEVLSLLWRGARNRAVSATDMNEHSSRSHTIFQVMIEQRPMPQGSPVGGSGSGSGPGSPRSASSADEMARAVRRSKLNLVDLAGSEKWKTMHLAAFSDRRIQELTSINQSLSNLGNVIRALGQPGRSHIPYRNSKLTRLLADSLGGNTKTAFIVTLSPSADAVEETSSTLQFADRAKKVVVHASVNQTLDDASLLRKYEYQIERLRAMLRSAAQASALQAASAPGSTAAGGVVRSDATGEATLRSECEALRREKVALLEETAALRTRLQAAEAEREGLLRAVGLAGEAAGGSAEDKARASVRAGLAAVQTARRAVEEREEEVARREAACREQQAWLDSCQASLRSLPLAHAGKEQTSLTVLERLALLDWTLHTQSSELQRAKALFVEERAWLRDEMRASREVQREVEQQLVQARQQLQQLQTQPRQPQPQPQQEQEQPQEPASKTTARWTTHTDPKTGRQYFHNRDTGETTWHKPPEATSAAAAANKADGSEAAAAVASAQRTLEGVMAQRMRQLESVLLQTVRAQLDKLAEAGVAVPAELRTQLLSMLDPALQRRVSQLEAAFADDRKLCFEAAALQRR